MFLTQLDNSIRLAHRTKSNGLRGLIALLVVSWLGMFATPTWAVHPYQRWAQELGIDEDVSYDGTRLLESQGQQFEMMERRAPGKMYTEMYLGNMTTGILLREDLKKSYTLMPSMGFYREDSMEDGLTQAANGMEFSKIEKVGSEDVNGHASSKYKTRFSDNDGKGEGFIWVTDTGVPIKMDMIYSNKDATGQRMTMQFTELNLRDQDPKFFELPSNLKPMSLGGGLSSIGAMMGMGGGEPATGSTASKSPSSEQAELAAAQGRCLEEAARAAREEAEEEEEGAFGMMMGAVSGLSSMADSFGLTGGGDSARAVYAPDASAEDIAAAAKSMGVTQADIDRCRQP
jgi:hypothetical protein